MTEIPINATLRRYAKPVSLCLLVLILTFATLVPGGPIETRSFSHLSPVIFWGFNAFLITLGMTALGTSFSAWRKKRAAFWVAIIVAWLYVSVFVLDWAHVFPTSPDPMGMLLCMIEILDAALCFYILLFSHKALGHI